ncbi:hypothetical protein GCM10012287_14380 [Streptomyces daqingensis]|uniref:Uncharacterized protein n=1 Tax=Streptomyces daqingensis TaxID=1472640 RepID=A0ABQ2M144_9ACTN|nr:hypothetical protein GCM10012287_14380 [Streptomyces daqingensis]
MAEHGQRETRAHFGVVLGGELVVRMEEVLLDVVEGGVQLHVQTRVVQGAVFDLPVAAWVVEYALPERGKGFGTRRRQGVQRAVAAASLQEAEQRTAGRYV